jgi:16S rRNA (guanine966-N2)-methyltransferase
VTLRVIGGEFGGRRLEAPAGRGTRPTRDAVREAWFNAIAADLPGATVIDLFSGTGALGIEALSRGADAVDFVESDSRAYRVLRRNLETLGLLDRARTRRADVFRDLEAADERAWHVALSDPPYGTGSAVRLVRVWLARPFSDILCVEHGRDELAGLEPDWHRAYGDTELSFFIASEES